jgi:hypothetical protein
MIRRTQGSLKSIHVHPNPRDLNDHKALLRPYFYMLITLLYCWRPERLQCDVWIPTGMKRCAATRCMCILPGWLPVVMFDRQIAYFLSAFRESIPQPVRSSGILDVYPDVEVYSWVWEAEKGKRIQIPELEFSRRWQA